MHKFNKWSNILCLGFLAFVVCAVTVCEGSYLYTVANVPNYCQLGGNRCGAACAQMIIQFCCAKASPTFVPSWYGSTIANQQYICHESGGVWSGWMKDYHDAHGIPPPYKHPDAVKNAIMDLKETAPGNYEIFHDTNRNVVMHDMLYWIKQVDYPSATMKGGTHWVLVYGYETDVEPTTSNTVTLLHISIIEPACSPCSDPANGGIDIPDITGSAWDANYWHQGVSYWASAAYYGEFVAVVEPPATKGQVKFEKEYVGKREEIIPVGSAMKKAAGYIKERKLSGYRALKFMAQARPQTPLLVNWQDQEKYYYLVPFATERGGPAKAVMIVNAYKGNYQECGALCRSLIYIPKKEAVNLLLSKTGIKKYKQMITTLKFVDSDITHSHYYPFWEIKIDDKAYYVDQNRKIHKELRIHK